MRSDNYLTLAILRNYIVYIAQAMNALLRVFNKQFHRFCFNFTLLIIIISK
jgi:hypothetical protein